MKTKNRDDFFFKSIEIWKVSSILNNTLIDAENVKKIKYWRAHNWEDILCCM